MTQSELNNLYNFRLKMYDAINNDNIPEPQQQIFQKYFDKVKFVYSNNLQDYPKKELEKFDFIYKYLKEPIECDNLVFISNFKIKASELPEAHYTYEENQQLAEKYLDTIIIKEGVEKYLKKEYSEKKLYFVAGQPASGKSVTNEADYRQGVYSVDSDEYRKYHPALQIIKDLGDSFFDIDINTAQVTNAFAAHSNTLIREKLNGKPINGELNETESNQKSIVMESMIGTGAEWFYDEIEKYYKEGYEPEIKIIATPKEVSRFFKEKRFLSQYNDKGYGRRVPDEVHDDAIDGMNEFLNKIQNSEFIKKVTLYNNGQEVGTFNPQEEDILEIYSELTTVNEETKNMLRSAIKDFEKSINDSTISQTERDNISQNVLNIIDIASETPEEATKIKKRFKEKHKIGLNKI